MQDARDLAALASLIGDPARARMLTALMNGCAWTATELATEAGVAASTASVHLAKLADGGIVSLERQGRHRYFRLFDGEVATMLEELTGVAARAGEHRRVPRLLPDANPLRRARVCYDHLAGEAGVQLLDRLRERELLVGRDAGDVSPAGRAFLGDFGIELESLARSRRPLCRLCLDWTERGHHLGGELGAALLERMFVLGWVRREPGSRVLLFSPAGRQSMTRWLA